MLKKTTEEQQLEKELLKEVIKNNGKPCQLLQKKEGKLYDY